MTESTDVQVGVAPAPSPAEESFDSRNRADRVWAAALVALGGCVLVLAGIVVLVLFQAAHPAFAQLGFFKFLTGQSWDPVNNQFGALPFIYGTLVTSAVAIILAVPIAIGLALFSTQLAPRALAPFLTMPVELLAAIPSVVYGLWGLFVLVPLLRDHVEPWLAAHLGFLPIFQGTPLGLGYLAGGVILAIMILPTISAIATEVIRTVPTAQTEAALALGATRWESIRLAVLPYSRAGLLGAVLLGLGRALGETMAVTMVIGNQPEIHGSLFSAGYTLPSVLANEFAEATNATYIGALMGLGLVLFGITLLLNAGARVLLHVSTGGSTRAVA